jgi:hypothetical protein
MSMPPPRRPLQRTEAALARDTTAQRDSGPSMASVEDMNHGMASRRKKYCAEKVRFA